MPSVTERIQNFKHVTAFLYTGLKYQAMAKDLFYFSEYRLFVYEDLPSPIPCQLHYFASADLHLENFGSYKGDNRLCLLRSERFWRGSAGACFLEPARMATSIFCWLNTMGTGAPEAKNMALLFLKSYSMVLSSGWSRDIEPQTAKGIVQSFLTKRGNAKQKDLVKERTTQKERRYRPAGWS